jgi:hypothetical protein
MDFVFEYAHLDGLVMPVNGHLIAWYDVVVMGNFNCCSVYGEREHVYQIDEVKLA